MNGTDQDHTPDSTQPDDARNRADAGTRPLLEAILFGRFGLRAGWSLLLYFALIATVAVPIVVHQQHRRAQPHAAAPTTRSGERSGAKPSEAPQTQAENGPPAPVSVTPMLKSEATLLGGILLLSVLMAWIERRRFGVYGLGGTSAPHRFAAGAFWGVAALSLLVGVLRALHLLSFDAQLDHGPAIFGWGALLLLFFLLVGVFEEYFFRGYVQFTLTRGLVGLGKRLAAGRGRTVAFWLAAVLTSALFFVAHTGNPGENRFGLLLVFAAGLLFVVALWRTGSLWWAIGFHTTWDWAQSFLYGVPDSGGLVQGRLFATHASGNPLLSGGSDGPEGSLLALPVIVLVILVLLFATRPSPQPPLEGEDQEAAARPMHLRLHLVEPPPGN